MKRKLVVNVRRVSTAASFGVLVLLSGLAPAAWGQDGAGNSRAGLESAFWLCDYSSSRVALDMGTAVACSSIYEELKAEKFNGDFEAMLAWWRENKPAEHGAIEAASRSSGDMEAAALRRR
jgi:hypothetical protein